MERFVVSARKYRPVTFDTVVGQPSITNTLKNAIRNNHLAQAFLFTGPRGVGKTTTARILAKTINCENISPNVEACNQCQSCLSFNTGQSLNIYELDAASNNSVDDIRALVDQVRYAPQMGKYKIYIIDEVHMLSANAFNAFLKTLEEPPSYAIFILATTEKHKILPTILSRCQIFDFHRIGIDDIVKHLQSIAEKENVAAETDALHVIAQKADGALRDSLSLFDQMVSFSGDKLTYKDVITNLNILDHDYYFRITDEIMAQNTSATLMTLNEIISNGFDPHNFISGLASHFRDLLVCKDEITLSLLEVSPGVRERYKVQSLQCSAQWLLTVLDLANKADIQYKQVKNQRLHIELYLLKMCASVKQKAETEVPKKKVDLPVNQPQTTTATPPAPAPVQTTAHVAPPPAPKPATTASVAPVTSPAPPPPSNPPAQGIPGRKTISISTQLNSGPEKKNLNPKEEVLPDIAEPFDPDKLIKVWNQYAAKLQSDGRMTLSAAMMKRPPALKDPLNILFTLDNIAIERDFNEQKINIVGYLRRELANFKIQLETDIAKEDIQNDIPYTPSEKFKKLAEKNPKLNELKKAFDLEIEY